ncbi:hypothetical protein B4U80_04426 [Leptotrombidium deliense]|uniref:Uncharacterized protein n=1 Tax=Leptotrombidium deliense TaxID=299467 RepID=A0A443RSE0_9ACAR|nr:hypothetical protein B4U80_04426 [Leptotrombidium deliense]
MAQRFSFTNICRSSNNMVLH